MRVAIITISTSKARGDGTDESGPALEDFARRLGAEVAGVDLVPDDRSLIEARRPHWGDEAPCDLALTTRGTSARARRAPARAPVRRAQRASRRQPSASAEADARRIRSQRCRQDDAPARSRHTPAAAFRVGARTRKGDPSRGARRAQEDRI